MSAKTSQHDPVEEAFLNAPEGDPLTDEERRLLAEAHADIEAGRLRTQEQIRETIEAMRRRQEGG